MPTISDESVGARRPGRVIAHAPLVSRLPLLEQGSVRQAVRRLRWFRRSFAEQVANIAAASGVDLAIADDRLAEVFVSWLRKFEAQKPATADARRAYTRFSSGLMLREMLRADPLTVRAMPQRPDERDPAHFWPQGHAYAVYCMNVRAAVLAQEFGETLELAHWWDDIEAWWSFKENVAQDPPLAIPYLDLFCGDEPEWAFPNLFSAEPADIRAFDAAALDAVLPRPVPRDTDR